MQKQNDKHDRSNRHEQPQDRATKPGSNPHQPYDTHGKPEQTYTAEEWAYIVWQQAIDGALGI